MDGDETGETADEDVSLDGDGTLGLDRTGDDDGSVGGDSVSLDGDGTLGLDRTVGLIDLLPKEAAIFPFWGPKGNNVIVAAAISACGRRGLQ